MLSVNSSSSVDGTVTSAADIAKVAGTSAVTSSTAAAGIVTAAGTGAALPLPPDARTYEGLPKLVAGRALSTSFSGWGGGGEGGCFTVRG